MEKLQKKLLKKLNHMGNSIIDIIIRIQNGYMSGKPSITSPHSIYKEDVLKKLKGKQVFEYPPYSSATVEGKQLFQWAREGRLNEIEIPRKEVEIYNIELLENYEISGEELLKSIINRVQKVTGDFRQKEITKQWQLPGALPLGVDFVVSKVRVNCSRGTYVRAIANKLGNDLGVGAIALKIKRNKVGEYNIKNSR